MQMIPSQPHATPSMAEKRVFDQLRAALESADRTGWFAMHSLNLPRHAYKRFGEIDFVVCGPEGLFVLEVKGGGVACHGGVWETTNRFGETERLKESPFKQSEGAMHGLCKKLPPGTVSKFTIGYGVIAPDSSRFPASAEWDREQLADARDFRQFERWLLALIAYWRRKSNGRIADRSALRELRQMLRPDFESVIPLHVAAQDVETRIARLTDDQLRLIDVVDANKRVLCYGGAETGKTMLALELAKRWVSSGKQVALACHSPWLKGFLERNAVPGLTVCLADSIAVAARRANVDRFDALIVDEGQDLLNMDSLAKLDSALRDGLEVGDWCFFHDANNQSGLCGTYVPDAYDYLRSLASARVPLSTNCRNTLQILDKVKGTLGADVGVSSVGAGPAVREVLVGDFSAATSALEAELSALTEIEGFPPSEITVLSPFPFERSCASSLKPSSSELLGELDSFSPRGGARSKAGFAQISDYKGLESEVVILVDLPPPGQDHTFRALHYVGMSRARALLSIISYGSSAAAPAISSPHEGSG